MRLLRALCAALVLLGVLPLRSGAARSTRAPRRRGGRLDGLGRSCCGVVRRLTYGGRGGRRRARALMWAAPRPRARHAPPGPAPAAIARHGPKNDPEALARDRAPSRTPRTALFDPRVGGSLWDHRAYEVARSSPEGGVRRGGAAGRPGRLRRAGVGAGGATGADWAGAGSHSSPNGTQSPGMVATRF